MTDWLDRRVSARALLAWVCLTAPSMLVSSTPAVRAAQLALLVIVALGIGRSIRIGRTVVFFAAVVAFNLVTPGGRVLAAPAGFPVTAGALEVGLAKAFGLTGLLLLSKIGIRRDLRLPGRAGHLLDLTLAYVRGFLAADVKLLARDPVGRLDKLLCEVQREVDAAPDSTPTPTTPLGVAVLTALLAASWAAVLVGN
ncbi:MAG: hypothetical protein OXP69_01365 [Spirochaetaceae bacterium]|nr:hypothetical protein [Spirochaetaceae bacterium]MDE0229217.1 hypothetical protein [Spirochaetaceae bacterium]MDE0446703.1 hypothetical protein [Spirochaetaceae bacterium]